MTDPVAKPETDWLQDILDACPPIKGYIIATPISAEDVRRCTRVYTF